MQQLIKPIETQFQGYRFRSRLEARWAVLFTALKIEWRYEAEGYDLGECGSYLPDFYLPELDSFIEIKSEKPIDKPVVYLAGKIQLKDYSANEWRKFSMKDASPYKAHFRDPLSFGRHGEPVHGDEINCLVLDSCLGMIDESEIVFVWIDSMDCFGTLAEIGYAYRMKQENSSMRIFIGLSSRLAERKRSDLWFVCQMADGWGVFRSPEEMAQRFLPTYPIEEEKCRALSIALNKNVYLFGGELRQGSHTSWRFAPGFDYQCSANDALEVSEADFNEATIVAQQARFEHGESPSFERVQA